jgi:hypothetical protein
VRHPLFAAIVLVGSSLAGCRTQPLPEPKTDLAEADLAQMELPDLAMCNCAQQPLPDPCRVPCILIL